MRIFTWRQRVYTFVITVSSIAIFAGLGYAIDALAGTSPAFLVLGLIGSFPVNALILTKIMRKII